MSSEQEGERVLEAGGGWGGWNKAHIDVLNTAAGVS